LAALQRELAESLGFVGAGEQMLRGGLHYPRLQALMPVRPQEK